jgi:protein gp37
MGENSKIEWTTHTFNPWIGCQKVSPGCDRCYAEAMMDHRYHKVEWGPHGERKRTSEANWKKPRQWAKAARGTGERPRVFCASLADVFDNQVPKEWRAELFDLIDATPELDWLLLTKRPENIAKMTWWDSGMPPNVWLGTTCEDQANFDRRWPILRSVRARIRFVSYEPAIGPLELFGKASFPDWIICGGESGSDPRTMQPEWARALRDECAERGVRFFMKQMTGKTPIPPDLLVRQFPSTSTLTSTERKSAPMSDDKHTPGRGGRITSQKSAAHAPRRSTRTRRLIDKKENWIS